MLVITSAVLLTGCHTLYRNAAPTFTPQSAYVPMLSRTGAEGSLSVGAQGLEGQVAFAPVANIVFTAQGQRYRADKGHDVFRSFEAGFGIIPWRLAGTRVGLLAGGGAGRGSSVGARYETWSGFSSARYDSADRQASATYQTFYLMPFLGRSEPDAGIEYAVAAKVYWLNYQRIEYLENFRSGSFSGTSHYQTDSSLTYTTRRDASRVHVQFVTQLAIECTPRIWCQLQAGADLDWQGKSVLYASRPFVVSVGVRYRFSP